MDSAIPEDEEVDNLKLNADLSHTGEMYADSPFMQLDSSLAVDDFTNLSVGPKGPWTHLAADDSIFQTDSSLAPAISQEKVGAKGGGKDVAPVQVQKGDLAARRRALSELFFFASVGDLRRCKRMQRLWRLNVADPELIDYDKRSPLHVAAGAGAFGVSEWLLQQGAVVNAVDNFKRTPLEEAVRADRAEVIKLLLSHDAKIFQEGKLVALEDSRLAGAVTILPEGAFELDPEWEIDPKSLTMLEKLGEGEFGEVFKALWHGTPVAAKVLKAVGEDFALGDFRSEVQVLRRVHHPNTVHFLGACTKEPPYILVTELMSGGSLLDAMLMVDCMSRRRALEMCVDMARGLAYMHSIHPSPIVHRDLKPGNILISGSTFKGRNDLVYDCGVVKIADFGLSRTMPTDKHVILDLDEKFVLTGECGSYRYMAPEVFRHEPYSYKVDVFSFAMICFQLFESTPPFSIYEPVEAAKVCATSGMRPGFARLAGPDPTNTKIRELIVSCWAADPEERPNFEQVIQTLSGIMPANPRAGPSNNGGGCCTIQ